jgi:hypothetical protein
MVQTGGFEAVTKSIARFRARCATQGACQIGSHAGDVQSPGPVLDEDQHI